MKLRKNRNRRQKRRALHGQVRWGAEPTTGSRCAPR